MEDFFRFGVGIEKKKFEKFLSVIESQVES